MSLFLGIVSFLILLPGIATDNLLLQGDEVMHIKTIRESLETGNILHPVLGGFSNPYKPPLLFWFGMMGDKSLGAGLIGERIPSVLLGSFSIVLIFWTLLEVGVNRRFSMFVSLLFLTSLGVFKFSRIAMMEIYMVFFLLLGLYFYIIYLNTEKKNFLVLSGLATGLGGLLKGPLLVVYAFIFLLTHWVLSRVRIRDGKTVWNSKPRFLFLKGIGIKSFFFIWAPLTVLPLLLWILAIIAWTDQGLAFTKFFLLTENIGKFGQENQPEFRILFGFILYSIPWTIVFFLGFLRIFRQKDSTKRQFIAKWILMGSIYILLLHLIPNRKDPYYALPSLATGILALGMGLGKKDWKEILTSKSHLGFQLLLALLILVGGWFFRSNHMIFLTLPLVFILYSLVDFRYFKRQRLLLLGGGIIAPVLTLLFFQTSILPSVPDRIPVIDARKFPKICVVSVNPWDAWEIENYTAGLKVEHYAFIHESCVERGLPILLTEEKDRSRIPEDYQFVKTWDVWGNGPETWESKLYRFDDPVFYKEYRLYKKRQR